MTPVNENPKSRAALLKELRERHQATVEQTRALLKDQQAIRRQICQQLRDGAKSVPEVSAATELPAHEVLWHITAMKKYDRVAEAGQCGEYYLYKIVKEAEE
jgi:hypothetical protein